jgi:vitamin K-dependent gamma-carboxylase
MWRTTSAASLAVFRMLFGAVAAFGALRFLAKGWVETLYLQPTHHLTYPGFDWVQPLPVPLMYLHMVVLAALGVSIAVGYRFRTSMLLYGVAFTYTELIEASLYLNHYWFVSMTSFVCAFLPLHTMWSLDARSGRVKQSTVVPAWALWTVRAQLAVVYVFAGIAKLQHDWLVRAQPMSMWLSDRTDLPLIGAYLDERWVAYAASWAGAAFDCTIVGWLMWKRSRPFAYAAVICFHGITGVLFQIGIFPWLMILGTLVFFSADWPVRVLSHLRHPKPNLRHPAEQDPVADVRSAQGPSATGSWFSAEASTQDDGRRKRRLTIGLLATLAVVEITIPLRHYAYPGDVRWTEEGYYGSWRVMLTEKGGDLTFRVTDARTREEWTVEPTAVLTDWQARQAATRPDLLLTTAHLIAREYEQQQGGPVEVRADSFVSFNARPLQRMVDPEVDLATVGRGPGHKQFILPLQGRA